MKKKPLSVYTLSIGSAIYRVYYIEEGRRSGFQKGCAYIVEFNEQPMVLPVRQLVKDLKDVSPRYDEPGIYAEKSDPKRFKIVLPKLSESEPYQLSNITNIVKEVIENTKNNTSFVDTNLQITGSGEWFQPPVREGDDAMNAIVKTAISLKQVPYNAYSGKLEYYAVGTGTSEGANVKGNCKKSLMGNSRMSTGKATYYCKSFDLQLGIVVKDAPGAKNPMFEDGSMLVIYPNEEFEIDPTKLIRVSEILDNKDEYFGKKDEDEEDVDIYE